MSRRAATLGVTAALTVTLGAAAAVLPVPYVALTPGEVYDTLGTVTLADGTTRQLIRITPADRRHPADGKLDLTTVSVYGGSDGMPLGNALEYWFDSTVAVVPREVVYPRDKSDEEITREVREEMTRSQESAEVAAFRELGIEGVGTLTVTRTLPGGPSAGVLRQGDVITAVDGRPVDAIGELRGELAKRTPGAPARIRYRRGTAAAEVVVRTVPSADGENRPTIGVEVNEDRTYPVEVDINTSDVGGPSAGLMFALGIIELLTPGSLTGGAHVAGTGTIQDDGTVGAIGGIQQKVVGARRAGAEYFLTPVDNFADAEAARPAGLELVKVATLKDAMRALERIRAEAADRD